MKKKPDLTEFVASKDPKDFMEGGAVAATEKPAQLAAASSVESKRITKTIRLRQDVELRLKDEAYLCTKAKGKRVTESDLIEEALIKYLNM